MPNFMPPRAGDSIYLLCLKCGHRYKGKMKGLVKGMPFPVKYKGKCPKCGSKRAIKDPAICY